MRRALSLMILVMVAGNLMPCNATMDDADAESLVLSYKLVGEMSGLVSGAEIIVDTFMEMEDDGGLAGAFAGSFLDGFVPGYNSMVDKYNVAATSQNNMTLEIFGEDCNPDLLFTTAKKCYR